MTMKSRVESRNSSVRGPEAKARTDDRLPVRLTGVSLQLAAFSLLILGGCATAPKSVPSPPPVIPPQPRPVPAAPVAKPPPPPPPPPLSPSAPAKAVSAPVAVAPPALAKDETIMTIDSDPAGAIIVVDDIPIGKAPQRLKVKTALHGFFRDYMTVKARFLAASLTEASHTVEEDCTPLEKIPGKIVFTLQGAQRRDLSDDGN
jgi:hypothetical protein